MKTEVSAGTILQKFYELRQKHAGKKPPAFFRKRVWGHAEAYLAWCGKAGVRDPLAFLEYRFEAAQHTGYVPQLHQLRSNKLAALWKGFKRDEHDVQKWSDDLHDRAGSRRSQLVRQLRILTPGHEAAKQPYASPERRQLCLAELDLTGGFHPDSAFCPACPLAVQCAAQLYQRYGFDVVSLRAGRLHALPRKVTMALVS